MKQSTTIPQTTMDRVIEDMRLNIANPSAVLCTSDILLEDPNQVTPPPPARSYLKAVQVNVNTIIADEIAAGNLTAANATGFKKCIKAICAKTLDLAYTEVNDPIV